MKNQSIYFCSECKKVLHNLEKLLFIEENSHKGFCSENCIEDFYSPLIRYFEVYENTLRRKYNLLDESSNQIVTESSIEDVLDHPDEVYKVSNELHENYYSFIKQYEDYTIIVVASVYNFEASFIFLTVKTSSRELINEFYSSENATSSFIKSRTSHEVSNYEDEADDENQDNNDEDEDEDMVFMQFLESKKSKILAEVLMKKTDDDIQFEDYNHYDFCFQETLDQPDEVFEYKDNEGDIIFFYLKSYSTAAKLMDSFTYIIIALKHKNEVENINVYPILAIPTVDLVLCQEFRKGINLLSGPLKN